MLPSFRTETIYLNREINALNSYDCRMVSPNVARFRPVHSEYKAESYANFIRKLCRKVQRKYNVKAETLIRYRK